MVVHLYRRSTRFVIDSRFISITYVPSSDNENESDPHNIARIYAYQ